MKIRQDKRPRKLGRTPAHLAPATRYTCRRCGIEKSCNAGRPRPTLCRDCK